jgi:hypothetical protein
MPNQLLLEQFNQLLAQSKSFGLLSPERQAGLKEGYANATDEQLTRGIEMMKADLLETARREAEFTAEREKAAEEERKLKEQQKKNREAEMAENRKKDLEESTKAAEALIEKLKIVPAKKESVQKKKKLFGIF